MDRNSVIVDSCGWPIERLVTVFNKHELTQQLLCEELLTKRMDALNNFREGLNYFGLVDLLKDSPAIGQVLFVPQSSNQLTAEDFLKCLDSTKPNKPEELKAYNHFISFVKEYEQETEYIPVMDRDVTIPCLVMKFATAKEMIPILGLSPKIKVQYLPEKSILPDANACFHILKLPTGHGDNYTTFAAAMKTALRHGSCSFGEA